MAASDWLLSPTDWACSVCRMQQSLIIIIIRWRCSVWAHRAVIIIIIIIITWWHQRDVRVQVDLLLLNVWPLTFTWTLAPPFLSASVDVERRVGSSLVLARFWGHCKWHIGYNVLELQERSDLPTGQRSADCMIGFLTHLGAPGRGWDSRSRRIPQTRCWSCRRNPPRSWTLCCTEEPPLQRRPLEALEEKAWDVLNKSLH